ncbi:hypothetical protein I3842_04G118700 [Carya illinoinensis]|uniref:Leucine-rich repeat family protein n=1 Tax=Carya illinoinensis TaxID=32201 RepID=A0A922F838_CARIL|nr:hypothetical protein I3842_04G118700 [Carya illinoinensis]
MMSNQPRGAMQKRERPRTTRPLNTNDKLSASQCHVKRKLLDAQVRLLARKPIAARARLRFLCFNSCIHCPKPKKTVQPSAEKMYETSQDFSQSQTSVDSIKHNSLNPPLLKVRRNTVIDKQVTTVASIESGRDSGDIRSKFIIEGDFGFEWRGQLRKSHSVGSNDTKVEIYSGCSFEGPHVHKGLAKLGASKDGGVSLPDESKRIPTLKSFRLRSGIINNNACKPISGRCSPFRHLALQSRSSDYLQILDMRRREISTHESERHAKKNTFENSVDDGYDCHNCSSLAKHSIMPIMDEVRPTKNLLGKPSVHHEWIDDLQLCSRLEETNESSQSGDQVKRDPSNLNWLNSLVAEQVDGRVASSMEVAKKYISSLSAIATTAQLANHGLALIPFLKAFTSLGVLNLSGNAIGSLLTAASSAYLLIYLFIIPDSEKNRSGCTPVIFTIDGLRELTRLRLLDLGHNRIFRIGHGLASCSTLKELYLAGNKISEVEGLHRLLKLNVLDLQFNKISTAKCLAIRVEGNPCQKNVGDEQLKKYLQGLPPYLTLLQSLDRSIRSDHKVIRKVSHGLAAHRPPSSSTHGHKSQAVVSPKRSKGRHGLLPPTGGTKVTTCNQYDDFDLSSKLLNFRPDLSIHRSQLEGSLRAL